MFAKLALATLLRICHPSNIDHHDHHYTVAEMSAQNPYSVSDWEKTVETQEAELCQCLTLKISPNGGMVMGSSRACSCQE